MKKFSEWEEYFGMWYEYDNKEKLISNVEFAKLAKILKLIKADSNGTKIDELHSLMGGF